MFIGGVRCVCVEGGGGVVKISPGLPKCLDRGGAGGGLKLVLANQSVWTISVLAF